MKIKMLLLFIPNLLFFTNAYSSVNMIAWWEFIDKQTISNLEKKCNTQVSMDEYYSADDFLRRTKKQHYSVLIFPAEVYNMVADEISSQGLNFEDVTKNYHPNVLALFKQQNLSKNIGIFSMGITGFLYDPSQIQISEDENIPSIFSKAKNKKISLLDDPMESLHLVNKDKSSSNVSKDFAEFKNLIKDKYYIITNDVDKITKEEKFAFAYMWIGDAVRSVNKHPHLKFVSIPSPAYISADFIATLDKSKETECVAKNLASQEFLNPILNRSHYFSPFGSTESFKNKEFSAAYVNFIDNHKKFIWLKAPNKEEYKNYIKLWESAKIEMNNKL
ncbi:hypothetical protein [Silvanigrella aquatica]|uniref:Spermidine/putrescine ABC transporter substrate-binding protein n=1 Tax=Silvanigrella aquatica TaxID=1915309 RepID=A0A1L4CX31_9BACT|nr:hypothetical protein [Silvanigrella aquatica]APJ02499.1 hypothetical protein AXG55_00530 [Silvanigrella aquatica]